MNGGECPIKEMWQRRQQQMFGETVYGNRTLNTFEAIVRFVFF